MEFGMCTETWIYSVCYITLFSCLDNLWPWWSVHKFRAWDVHAGVTAKNGAFFVQRHLREHGRFSRLGQTSLLHSSWRDNFLGQEAQIFGRKLKSGGQGLPRNNTGLAVFSETNVGRLILIKFKSSRGFLCLSWWTVWITCLFWRH